ncbi:MAG: hypothetical protein A3B03_01400 [Candidatus Zambryskibacteria bacterium RIFCSPLOWO2_01_FULL_42_41]|nr:MAG: hypothetical protein A2829_02150 [Candidatus Zambryskibacteria bacterium RIFCSPHIGHO2_01_FULL_43_60]OHB04090.1 MAG: hypothetical protein A3B03_01400 [Candidatus Zambryskibacteria bacterium RIFCSPLOWO2_01_FULL_42_41]
MTQEQALSILKTGANVFLTGEPGSGKTHTINRYVSHLRAHKIEPAITASTGIAATHIGGLTIHSWSGIGIKKNLDKYDLDRIASNERLAKRIRNAKVLIIDEISMLAAETLRSVDLVCREVRQNESEPFGGLQVLLVGDFFQLPPVVKRELESEIGQETLLGDDDNLNKRFAYHSPVWQEARFITCYLSEQYRQDDKDFLSILSAIRRRTYDSTHHAHIEKRRVKENNLRRDITRLFSHNEDVDRINTEELGKLSGHGQVFEMKEIGPALMVATLKKGCLAPEKLVLKKGAKVMFIKNNPAVGFVNGTLGTVSELDLDGYPIIRTRDGREIVAEPMDWTIEENRSVKARVSQVPLRLAWAITVHKSQGMSLDEAVMDLSDVFEFGQGYVALSRVRRLNGLHIIGWNKQTFQVHPDVFEKDSEFRDASRVAMEKFQEIAPDELAKMHNNFIRASGGKFPEKAESEPVSIGQVLEKGSRLAKLREKHTNAYGRWREGEEKELAECFNKGESIRSLAVKFGRQPGGIRSRLIKLSLIEDDYKKFKKL